ncbi:ribose 1,5-bisphosphate isomerase [Salarchaeum japonicum]|uniref:Ribose 1,5-bisphosphate isomerase n=1 Tax=Salarchaeum japonicum TaxID=555573 RepID=A0AAV3SYG5_9EURY|nr:ribose 1,5-bisphosphate isomerase [Salarchaeum japonicum]
MVSDAVADTAERIASMDVRGAATIARAAADALAVEARESDADTPGAFRADVTAAADRLRETRPTAVSLPNALRLVLGGMRGESVPELRESVITAVEDFRAELDAAQDDLGRVGGRRFADGDTVMTHCHSTDALACVEHAVESGKSLSAYVKETRPRKQGHITAERLRELGVETTIIVDSAAHHFLPETDHVLVGADAVRADGAVVNKIGTAGLAASASERDVPVTVAAQTLKLAPRTLAGHPIEIEERDPGEVLDPDDGLDVAVANPAFDVTPARYIDAVVTERGQYAPESLVTLMRDRYGDRPDDVFSE